MARVERRSSKVGLFLMLGGDCEYHSEAPNHDLTSGDLATRRGEGDSLTQGDAMHTKVDVGESKH